MLKPLISIKNCRIENSKKTLISDLSWEMFPGEAWLVIGPNGGGKADFINALAGNLSVVPNADYFNCFENSTDLVSLERAAHLIQEERENDESEYVEGGVDIGRTGRVFIAEGICGPIKKNAVLPDFANKLEGYPEIKLCGIEKILDRGLKYMSTGEIRRTLLARVLISQKKLLLLSDPFAGLDVQSRKILLDFFDVVVKNQLKDEPGTMYPHTILGMERWHEIPDSITNVIEFTDKKVSFCGKRADYEILLEKRAQENKEIKNLEKEKFSERLNNIFTEQTFFSSERLGTGAKLGTDAKTLGTDAALGTGAKTLGTDVAPGTAPAKEMLVEMNNVNVGWGDNHVLIDLSWKLFKGEHWLIQGPNGSGKTTFLELITGDNMQVYCNDVRLFGIKRGSGESIWDIKKRLGIVSYRLHVEYRMLGGTSLQNVIISGLRDSIGLYGAPSDLEIATAKSWLALGGFSGRESESFGNLSYGEQRAVLILRSAVKSPNILILDEPCHGLDEQYREKILQLMTLIGKGGTTTMLHVTHDLSEVLECEKHILQFHPGENPMYQIIIK